MKKVYKKPNIIFEDFTLSTSIAAGCERKANNVMYSCEYFDNDLGYTIFTGSISKCTLTPQDGGDEYNGICYHVPVESNNLFNS